MKVRVNNSIPEALQKKFLGNPKELVGTFWLIHYTKINSNSAYHACRIAHVTKSNAIAVDEKWETHKVPHSRLIVGDRCIFLGYTFQYQGYVEHIRSQWLYRIYSLGCVVTLELVRGDPATLPTDMRNPYRHRTAYSFFELVEISLFIRNYRQAPDQIEARSAHDILRGRIQRLTGPPASIYSLSYVEPVSHITLEAPAAASNPEPEPEPVRLTAWERIRQEPGLPEVHSNS